MAIAAGTYSMNASLILNPSGYTSGGTNLGIVGKGHAAGFNYDVTLYTQAPYGSQFVDATIEGVNLIYEVILLEASSALVGLINQNTGGKFEGLQLSGSSYKLGTRVTDSQTHKLLIRPASASQPHLYIPRGLVIDVGPVIWDRGEDGEVDAGLHFSATRILIAALYHKTRQAPFHYGNPADLAAI